MTTACSPAGRDTAPDPSTAAADAEAGWFGDQPVDPSAKTGRVHAVFDSVARRYDLMNDLMSGGIHRLWKRRFIDRIAPRDGRTVLDVAGGTGDIALAMVRRAPAAEVIVCDLTEAMVRVGRDRMIDQGVADRIRPMVGNAEQLPLPDRSVDTYTIAFGLRNVSRIDTALREARRVLRPGGRFFCLEFSRVTDPALERLYQAYSFQVIPRIGAVVTRDRDSYRYLVESIRRHPDQAALAGRMEAAGLARVAYENLTFGVAAIHSGWRL